MPACSRSKPLRHTYKPDKSADDADLYRGYMYIWQLH